MDETQLTNARRLGHRPVLDGLRGVAIVLVILTHTSVLPNGYVGVDLFFALSGFLITTLLYEEWDRHGRISLKRFYERRARRLLPALGVLLVIAVVVNGACYSMTGWSLGKKALLSLLFVNNWIAASGHASDLGSLNPTWSLAQEEQFYLVWPLVLIFLLRWRVRPEFVTLLLMMAIVTLVELAPRSGQAHVYAVYYSPLARAAELLSGCLGAVIWRHRLVRVPGRLAARLPAPVRALTGRKQLWRGTAACILAYLFVRLLFNDTLLTEQVYLRACLLAVPLIVNLIGAPASLLARAVACAPLRYLGRISYALYLFHLLARNVVYHYLPHGPTDLNALLTIALSIALAATSWKLIESWVLARGRQRRGRPARRPGAAVLRRPVLGTTSS
ncbi:MAG TPA: acyltransferase [Solirubrobacteraceae bacterium]|nr:acyltransferase [Solirubrobacteraceae bacterium]